MTGTINLEALNAAKPTTGKGNSIPKIAFSISSKKADGTPNELYAIWHKVRASTPNMSDNERIQVLLDHAGLIPKSNAKKE